MNALDPKISRPVALVILDGWGYAPRTESNAIAAAHTPYYDEICRSYPMTTLEAGRISPGAEGQTAGNSEVGHLSLGSGRLARTDADRVRQAVATGEIADNEVLVRALSKALAEGSAVHLIGLISDAGVHSSPDSLFAILRMAKKLGLKDVFIHCILDGLDVPERTADIYVEALEIKLADIGIGQIATLCGRYFAMDSGENWERTARAFTLLAHGEGERSQDAVSAIRNSFLRGISDEFISPIVIERELDKPLATIRNGDLVIFFNHRGDGMRQLVRSLCVADGAGGAKPVVDTVCLTEYDPAFKLECAFTSEPENNSLIQVLDSFEIPTTRITEVSRQTHLTHFFEGGSERGDLEHVIITDGRSAGRDLNPESQSFKIVDRLRRSIEASPNQVFVVNLPAADLMAETGDLNKTIAAIQFVDTCLGGICEKVREYGGVAMITSSHGNCEEMIHSDSGEPNPLPTSNPVPFHFVDDLANGLKLDDGKSLADVAPTLLAVLGIEKPNEMTGSDIRVIDTAS